MNNSSARKITLAMVPFLLMDPALAASRNGGPFARQNPLEPISVFYRQALARSPLSIAPRDVPAHNPTAEVWKDLGKSENEDMHRRDLLKLGAGGLLFLFGRLPVQSVDQAEQIIQIWTKLPQAGLAKELDVILRTQEIIGCMPQMQARLIQGKSSLLEFLKEFGKGELYPGELFTVPSGQELARATNRVIDYFDSQLGRNPAFAKIIPEIRQGLTVDLNQFKTLRSIAQRMRALGEEFEPFAKALGGKPPIHTQKPAASQASKPPLERLEQPKAPEAMSADAQLQPEPDQRVRQPSRQWLHRLNRYLIKAAIVLLLLFPQHLYPGGFWTRATRHRVQPETLTRLVFRTAS